jgi:hypothetical protein
MVIISLFSKINIDTIEKDFQVPLIESKNGLRCRLGESAGTRMESPVRQQHESDSLPPEK